MNLLEAYRIVYSDLQPDFYKMNKGIVDILAMSVANLATMAYIANKPERPANMYITLLGSPRSGKTTALRILTATLDAGKIAEIPNGTPEAIVEALENKMRGYLFWDEAEELLKKVKTYMDIFPNLLNKMYYSDSITMARRTSKSVRIPRRSYYVNVYMTALPEQWGEIEETFSGGFSRRTLTLYTKGEIPLFNETAISDDDRATNVIVSIAYTLITLQQTRVMAVVRGLSAIADKIQQEIIEHEKLSMVEEYLYKIAVGKTIAECIEVPEPSTSVSPEWILDRFIQNLKRAGYTQYNNLDDIISNIDNRTIYRFTSIIPSIRSIQSDDYNNRTNCTNRTISTITPLLSCNGNISFVPIELNILLNHSEPDELYHTLSSTALNQMPIADRRMYRIITRIQQYGKRIPIMSRREFIRNVLKMRNANQYTAVMRYLVDAEFIRTVKYKRRSFVVLDPNARICANCKHFEECKTRPNDSCNAFEPVSE